MSGVSKIKIKESIETLKLLLNQQKSSENFQKIQGLYLLKSKQAETITEVAALVGRHRITVQGWLRSYSKGGIEALLTEKTVGGRKSSIPDWAIEILKEKLQNSLTFETYTEIQLWLETELDIKVSYDVVHYLVHDKLKISLKKNSTKD